jgi:ABC-type glycerol-3-phosphate transport system substrate-binding protein
MDHSSDPTPESPSTSSRRSFLKRVGALGLAASAAGSFGSPLVAHAATRISRAADDSNALTLWTFVDTHARWFKRRASEYQKQVNRNFNLTVRVQPYIPHHQKLLTVLQTGVGAPDLADVEQGQFGAFLHGTVPFVPLEQRLNTGHYLKNLVASREALYAWKGHVYGIEHALTPVVLYYREDYFKRYGLKPTDLVTWDDFVTAGKTLKKQGIYILPTELGYFETLLRQRGSDFFDAKGNLIADSPLAINTLQWLIDLNFKHHIAKAPAGFSVYTPEFYAELQKGTYATLIGADWYAGFMADNAGTLSGKWRAMPLPVWPNDKAKRRTSCLGGTGLCIPVTTSKTELAWDFIRFCLLTTVGEVEQYLMIQLWPPFIPAWSDRRLHSPNPNFGGQDLGAVFAEVGREVPPEYQSPFRATFNNLIASTADGPNVLTGKIKPAAFLKYEAQRTRAKMKQIGT